MKSREWLFGFFSSLVAVPAIAHQAEPPRSPHPKNLPTIIRLKDHNDEILVKSDGETLYYTIVGDGGGERTDLRLDEIRTWKPELYERLKTTVADPKIDASNRYDEKSKQSL